MILTIRRYPDPVLLRPAAPVERIDDALRALARDMVDTMRDANGVGLAAPQVGAGLRMVVVDLEPDADDPRAIVLINPVLTRTSREKQDGNEGCLSFPGVSARLRRAREATVSALDLDGRVTEYTAEGLIARAFQHELDHLDGLVFVDKLGPTARRGVRDALASMVEDFGERRREGWVPPEGPVARPEPVLLPPEDTDTDDD